MRIVLKPEWSGRVCFAFFLGLATLQQQALEAARPKTKRVLIKLSPSSDERLRKTARTFGGILRKISGLDCAVADGADAKAEIVLALESNYEGDLKIPEKLRDNLEAFAISSGKGRLVIVGRTAKAVEDGVCTYLRKLGCRWFFPGKKWTILPRVENLFIDWSASGAPDFRNRWIWYQYGFGADEVWNRSGIRDDYLKWFAGNRMGGAFDMSCGHAWGDIAKRNAEAFKAHPEYYAMGKDGKRIIPPKYSSAKFCCSNPDLIKLVAEDRLKLLEEMRKKNPNACMVSVDPSDGPHMCHCANCAKLGAGRPSDMVVHLANEVVRHIRKKHPEAWVGFYAYSAHQYPPKLKIEPHVYVQMAMGFNSTGFTLDELLEKWGERGASLGVREYYGVFEWGENLPGRDRGGKVGYHREKIPKWRKLGLTSINAESMNSWGAAGPGYYVAAQLMWDADADVDSILEDFYSRAFGKAAKPIKELYAMWQSPIPILPGYIAKWLSKLDLASKLTSDPAVLARINLNFPPINISTFWGCSSSNLSAFSSFCSGFPGWSSVPPNPPPRGSCAAGRGTG